MITIRVKLYTVKIFFGMVYLTQISELSIVTTKGRTGIHFFPTITLFSPGAGIIVRSVWEDLQLFFDSASNCWRVSESSASWRVSECSASYRCLWMPDTTDLTLPLKYCGPEMRHSLSTFICIYHKQYFERDKEMEQIPMDRHSYTKMRSIYPFPHKWKKKYFFS